jgi:hypothetical protein
MSKNDPLCSFEAQRDRVMFAAGVRTQAQLAALMGITQASISNTFARRHIPARWVLLLFKEKRINPEWIHTGEGPMINEVALDTRAVMPADPVAGGIPASFESVDEASVCRFLRSVPLKYLIDAIAQRSKKMQ